MKDRQYSRQRNYSQMAKHCILKTLNPIIVEQCLSVSIPWKQQLHCKMFDVLHCPVYENINKWTPHPQILSTDNQNTTIKHVVFPLNCGIAEWVNATLGHVFLGATLSTHEWRLEENLPLHAQVLFPPSLPQKSQSHPENRCSNFLCYRKLTIPGKL